MRANEISQIYLVLHKNHYLYQLHDINRQQEPFKQNFNIYFIIKIFFDYKNAIHFIYSQLQLAIYCVCAICAWCVEWNQIIIFVIILRRALSVQNYLFYIMIKCNKNLMQMHCMRSRAVSLHIFNVGW